LAHALAAERQVDIRGLAHAVEGIGRIVDDFVSTIRPTTARVTAVVRNSARVLGKAGRALLTAGSAVVRKVRTWTRPPATPASESAPSAASKTSRLHQLPA